MDSTHFFPFPVLPCSPLKCHVKVLPVIICNISLFISYALRCQCTVPFCSWFPYRKRVNKKNVLFRKSIYYISLCSAFHFIGERHIPKDEFVFHPRNCSLSSLLLMLVNSPHTNFFLNHCNML